MRPRDLLTSLISSIRTSESTTNPSPSTASNPLLNAPESTRKLLLTLHVLFPHELLPALDLLDRNLITCLTLQQDDHHNEATVQVPHPRALSRDLSIGNEQARAQTEPRQLRHQLPPPAQDQNSTVRDGAHQNSRPEIPPPPSPPQIPHPDDESNLDGQNPALDHERSPSRDPAAASHPRHADAYVVRSSQLPHRVRAKNMMEGMTRTAAYEVRLKAWTCSCPAFAFAAFPAVDKRGEMAGERHRQQRCDWEGKQWRFGGLTVGEDVPVCKHLLACVLAEHSEVLASLVESREVSEEELAGWAAGWGD